MYDDNDWVESIKSRGTWVRGFFMVLFAAALWFSRILLFVLAVVQFSMVLITGRPAGRLLPFGRSLSTYMRDIGMYLSWNSDDMPWPGSTWPAEADMGEENMGKENMGEAEYREDDPGDPGAPPADPAPLFDPSARKAKPTEEDTDGADGEPDDTPEESSEKSPGEPPRPDA